jgi:DNA-binding transcriptional LysR family regulator
VADAALETHLAERASRLGGQLDYRVRLRNLEHVAMHVEAGIGISILSEGLARTLRRDLAVLPLSETWAARRLYLCARDFSALTPHAGLLAEQLRQCAT